MARFSLALGPPRAAAVLACVALLAAADRQAWGQSLLEGSEIFGASPHSDAEELPRPRQTPPGGAPVVGGFPSPETLPSPPEELPAPGEEAGQPQFEGRNVVDVRVAGNQDVPLDDIVPLIKTRPGRPLNRVTVQEDIRRLNQTRKFINVRTEYRDTPQGTVVIYRVVERPRIHYIKYVGNQSVRPDKLAQETGLAVGQPLDPYTIDDARRKIDEYYRERGRNRVRVTVLEGDKPGDRGAVFLIHEGPVQKVRSIRFVGNRIAGDARLKTQIETSRPFLGLFGGYVERDKIDGDVNRLTAYYRSLGFFRARVGRELVYDEDGEKLRVTFVIDEGPRYKVRRVSFAGHTIFRTEDLQRDLELTEEAFFDQGKMNRDVARVQEYYGAHGYILADIQAEPRFLEEPGTLDLVYAIHEGDRYRVGRIDVKIKGLDGSPPHSHQRTVLNRLDLRPGDIVDIRKIRAAERRLLASGLFHNEPARGIAPRIVITPMEDAEEIRLGESSPRARGQSPDGSAGTEKLLRVAYYASVGPEVSAAPSGGESVAQSAPRGLWQPPDRMHGTELRADHRARVLLPWRATPVRPEIGRHTTRRPVSPSPWRSRSRGREVVRAQSPSGSANPNPQPVRTATAPAGYPSTAGPRSPSQVFGEGGGSYAPTSGAPPVVSGPPLPAGPPDALPPVVGGELVPPGGYYENVFDDPRVILEPTVSETQTGRFSFGVGVNSDAGVVGQIVLDERNFSIRNVPRSAEDWTSASAFRGDGQRFRIEAVPGSQVQRYAVTFNEPYLNDTPISFGVSGFLFDRRYEDWDEQRVGGNVSFGYQIRPDVSVGLTLTAQNVDLRNPRFPTPPSVFAALGDSDLYGARLSLAYDTRDNPFLATEGQLVELSYEQTFGEFDYPRAMVDARRYFLIRQRPDGSGRHVLSVRGRFGVTGNQTPVFERFFAGGFTTLRGFDFRGASPRVFGTAVGGEMLALGSVQYMLPITADDALRMVTFVDFGTVEESVRFESDDFRVAPGVGLRINIPAMGPAPIALDFAWAVNKEVTDDTQVFSFFVGFQQ